MLPLILKTQRVPPIDDLSIIYLCDRRFINLNNIETAYKVYDKRQVVIRLISGQDMILHDDEAAALLAYLQSVAAHNVGFLNLCDRRFFNLRNVSAVFKDKETEVAVWLASGRAIVLYDDEAVSFVAHMQCVSIHSSVTRINNSGDVVDALLEEDKF